MRREIYPLLRRVDYELAYNVAPIGIERGKEILKTRPGNLSLNEMFLIAETYASGSPEYNEVFEIAARVFPDSDEANLNAAAIALGRRDATTAERHLNRVKNHNNVWWNNMGALWWLKGDNSQALGCFRRAGETANASEMEKLIASADAKAAAEAQIAEQNRARAVAAATHAVTIPAAAPAPTATPAATSTYIPIAAPTPAQPATPAATTTRIVIQ
jgi:hypothetical protein